MEFRKTMGDVMASPFVRTAVLFTAALGSQIAKAQTQHPAPIERHAPTQATSDPKLNAPSNHDQLMTLLGISSEQADTLLNAQKIKACFDVAFQDLKPIHLSNGTLMLTSEAKTDNDTHCRVIVRADSTEVSLDVYDRPFVGPGGEFPSVGLVIPRNASQVEDTVSYHENVGPIKEANAGHGPLAISAEQVKQARDRAEEVRRTRFLPTAGR